LHHIKTAKKYGIPVVVAVNRFLSDTPAELELVRRAAVEEGGAEDAVICDHWEKGGEGAIDLANAVFKACEKPSNFKFLYPLDWSIKQKIETIAKEVYGADGVDYLPEAEERIAEYTRLGFDKLPICMAKTHLSLSHDAALKGVPTGFASRSGISEPRWGPASFIRCWEQCPPCLGCRPGRCSWKSTLSRRLAGSSG
jgi:formyltetrahydrofolate synthetase